MPILIKKRERFLEEKKIKELAAINLCVGIGAAMVTTIWAIYINSFLHNEAYTGLVSGALTIISFIAYFLFIPLIEKSNKGKLFAYSLFLTAIVYSLFAFINSFSLFLILAIVLTLLLVIRVSIFGVILKDSTKQTSIVKNEGFIYTLLNIGWLVGPLIAGYTAAKFGIPKVFLLGAIFILIGFFVFKLTEIKDSHIQKKTDHEVIKNFKEFFKDSNRTNAYIIRGGITFWWGLIYLFAPLYIIKQGLTEIAVGYFMFAVVIPLILFEYKFSALTEKYSFKKIFKIGFLITAAFGITAFFFSNIYLILSSLVLASIGLAMLEPTSEAYFLTITNRKEVCRFFGPFNTSSEIFALVGRIIPSLFLLILPFKYVFLVFGLAMFFFALFSNRIK